MLNNIKKPYRVVPAGNHLCYALLFVLLVSSCGPVNRLSRLKRTPREYSLNYCYSDLKAPKNRLCEETWIVFSDRDNNDTYQNPGGKINFKQMSFMDAFFVLREKGEFVQLVKYDPKLVAGNPRARIMKNRKEAQYYGWARRSNLLLTKQSSLDMATGFKNKAVTMIVDSLAISQTQLIFDDDSILTYRDEALSLPNIKIPVHEILYILKPSPDGRKILTSHKTQLDPMEAPSEALGWISTSIIKELGQRLFVADESVIKELGRRLSLESESISLADGYSQEAPSADDLIPDAPGDIIFRDRLCRDTLDIEPVEWHEIKYYSNSNPLFQYAPVRSYQTDSGMIRFHTALPAPLIDKSRMHVLNLNGNKIMYADFLQLEKDLRKMNFIFVFEGRERVLAEYPRLMSVVQNLQSLLNEDNDPYRYKFGAVLSYKADTRNISHRLKSHGLTESFDGLMEYLSAEMDSVANYQPIADQHAWLGMHRAVEMMEEYPDETNLMIVIGESGFDSEKADSIVAKRIAKVNGRIIGYQIFNEIQSDNDNNFVLQIENLIENVALYDVPLRRERLVFTHQFKPDIYYRESMKNVYTIDQQKSMSQGWILFPPKSVEMQHDILTQAIDTIFTEIRADNNSVIECLYRAFNEFGDKYYRYSPAWTAYNIQDSLWNVNRELLHKMPGKIPAWFMPSTTLSFDNGDTNLGYHLLLSESELKEINGFLEDITRYEPDYKYKGKRKNVKRCNCPDDNPTVETQQNELLYDKYGDPLYLNTRQIRNHLYTSYMSRLKSSYKMRNIRPCRLRYYTLADAGLEIVGNPAKDEITRTYKVRDIKWKKRMKNAELDLLILYFKHKRAELETFMHKNDQNSFVSNEESYYWISRDLLP